MLQCIADIAGADDDGVIRQRQSIDGLAGMQRHLGVGGHRADTGRGDPHVIAIALALPLQMQIGVFEYRQRPDCLQRLEARINNDVDGFGGVWFHCGHGKRLRFGLCWNGSRTVYRYCAAARCRRHPSNSGHYGSIFGQSCSAFVICGC